MCLPKLGMANPYPLRLVSLPSLFLLRFFEIDGLSTVFGIWVLSTLCYTGCVTPFSGHVAKRTIYRLSVENSVWLCLIS